MSSFFLDLLVGCSSTLRCAYQHFYPNRQPLLVLWNKHSGGCHFSQHELLQVLLRWPSRHSTTGAASPGTSGSRCFSLILLHERIRRRIRWCNFSTLFHIVAEIAIVSCRTLPVGFPLPTISKNSLYTLFCSLILDHGVLLIISISGPKILISNILLGTSFHHVVQFQYGLEFFRLSYS